MSNVYDFDRWQRMQQQSASAQLNAAFEHNPDDVAKAFDLSKQTGMDPSTIHDNMDEFTHDYKSELGAQLLRNNEAITNFVNAHPLHAPLIHDDVANLDQATESFKKLKGDPTGEAVKGFSEGFEKPDLPQDPTLASAVNKFISVSPMVQGVKAFGEGFGSEGLGSWVDKQKVEPEWQEWVEKHPETFQSLKQGLGNVGIPLELFTRTFSGVIRGLGGWASAEAQRQGMTETQGNKLGADLAGMAEMQLMGVGVHGAKPPAGAKPGAMPWLEAATGIKRKPPTLNLDVVKAEIAKLRPYLEAGEPPPPGISEVFDKARAEQSKLAAKALDTAVGDADATKLKQRSPEKLAELLNELPDVPVRISSEAVRKLYGDKAPEPGDGILGWVPGIQDQINHPHVNVSARTLVANIDKEVFKALKDDIASGDNLTLNEAAEPIEYGTEPAGAIKSDPLLESVRKGAGLEAEPKGSISQAQIMHDAEWELSGADEHLRIAQESAPFTEKFISRISKGEKSFDQLDSAIQLTAQYVRGMKRKFASISADSEFPALRKLSEVSEAVRKLEEAGAKADLDGALEAIKDVRARLDELGEMRGTKPWTDEDYEREAGPKGAEGAEKGPLDILVDKLNSSLLDEDAFSAALAEVAELSRAEVLQVAKKYLGDDRAKTKPAALAAIEKRHGEDTFDHFRRLAVHKAGGTVGRQSLVEIESLRNAAAEKYGTLTVAQFMEKVGEPKKLADLPKALWDFLSKEIKKVSGDTKVIVMPKEEFPNKVAQTNGWAAYFTSDNKTGDRTIYYDKNYLEKNPEDAARLMLHEAGHDLTMRALYTDVDIANMVRDMLEETRDQAVELSKLDQLSMSYGLADIHEFMSEALSNDHFQTALAAMRLPDDLVSRLGLDLKDLSRRLGRPATMWDAIIQTVRRLIEKAIGRIDNGYSVLEGVLRVAEDIIPMRAAEQARVRRSGKGEGYVIPEDVWQIGKRSEDRANYGGVAGAEAPFDKGAAIGRTQKELSKYEELIAKRDAEDVAWRLKRAERQAKLENSREWKEESDKIRPEVENEVNTRPEVASYRFFSEGYYNGRTLDRKPKLDKNLLSEEQLASIPDQFVSSRGGLSPDDVGNLFGFSHGADLINSLATLEGEAASGPGSIVDRLVKAEVYNKVNAKLGESAAERLDEVKDHALGLTPMEMLHEKVLSFAQAAGIKTPISKAEMDAGARKLLGQMDFGTLKSDRLLREAAKSARKISGDLLKDDPLASYKEAQYQYLTTAMAKEARKVEREGKAFERVAKRMKAREQDGLTPEYTNWAHDLLIRLGRDVNRTAEDLSTEIMAEDHHSLESFLDAKEGAGADIYMPEFMVDPSFKQDLKDMKVSQARQAMAGVRSLVKAGRDEQKIITAGDKFDKKEFNGKLITQLATIKQTDQPVAKGIRKLGRMVTTNLLNAETVLNRLDRDDAFGLFNYNIGRPMYEGATTKSKLAREVGKQLREIKDDANLREQIPNTIWKNPWEAERPGGMSKWDWANASLLTMTRENLRVVMANMGNADNLDRMARGHGLEPQQIEDWVNQHATEKDWDWVEKLGRDVFGGLNKISANLARQRGAAPPEPIPIVPIDTPFGKRDGWYYPVIHDPTIARRSEPIPDGALFKGPYVTAGTAQGYTKRRTNSIGPLNLTFDGLAHRLSQEIHDIAFRDPVVNAMKVFGDPDFKNALSKTMGKEYGDMLVNWVKSVANESVGHEAADHILNQASEFFRQNIIGNLIGMNIHTVEKHTPTAAANSINEIGAKWFGQAVQELYARDPATGQTGWQFAMEKFEELQRRHQNMVESVSGSQQELLRPSLMKNASSWTMQDYFDIARAKHLEYGTVPVAFFDLLSAVPTALGEYRKQIEAGKSEGDAIYAGNRAVRRAHGSTAITNRPQVMRNYHWIASIYGFWNNMFNRQWEMGWMAKEAAGLATRSEVEAATKTPPQLGMKLFTFVILPAVVEEYVSSHTNAEKEGYLEWGVKAIARELSSTMPLVREVVNSVIEGRLAGFGLGSTAMDELTELGRDISTHGLSVAFDRNHAGKTLKHTLTLLGAATGLVNGLEANIGEYTYNLSTGKERPPKDIKELYRGVTKGETHPPTEPDYIERMLPGKVVKGRRR